MKKLLCAALFCVFALPLTVFAQEDGRGGQLMMIMTWDLDPSHIVNQNTEMAKLAEAARTSGLEDPGASWFMWTSANSYLLVFPFENFAYLDDPQAFVKQFDGKPGQEMALEAFASMESIPSSNSKTELVMLVPEWTRDDNPGWEAKYARITDYWINAGQEEAFSELVSDVIQLQRELNYPYPLHGHRVLFGDVDRFVFVEFYDDRAAYWGENSWDSYVEKAGRTAEWDAIVERFLQVAKHWQDREVEFQGELSYLAPN